MFTRPALTRRQAAQRLMRLARIRRDQSAFDHGLRRGRCARKGCDSRLAIVRLTFDFRDAREINESAELVCATCDRVWATVKAPDIRRHRNGQRVRLTLILPPEKAAHTWIRHGATHRSGEDALTVAEANHAALLEAQHDWRVRNEKLLDRQQRVKDRQREKAETEMADWRRRMAEVDKSIAARDAAARELGI